ncbi:DUF5686 and carboxypeptidase regulatory-like domain-containing protein [Cecembia lonarensis]|uniref:TonB-linked outer membrane protein, SusC/RagA family n=1 Tax=Cecembia lonarensis (strain CCUG 58316 / KCTC 22772 / LW9) TaxID=1225176 RepID=K1LEM4_CECL9|nr:DUF5686 and carboxypeptidase regulatory-like domain-containing protein [Cecembia lonarensis]EKB48768.1 TonB-linked outer membrane protein, SusC/RagA family [Cecembia lonarensis LW9]
MMPAKKPFIFTITFLLLLIFTQALLAQGIRGKVLNEKGEPLPFASIYIRNIGEGIPANQNGEFELKLRPGAYDVVAQYLGFATEVKTALVQEGWVTLDFTLKEQVYALQEVTVKTNQEDPALTIMRKAISKAKFHRLQVQEYSMMVYLKGTGKLTNAPFFLKKELEKDGFKLNEAYTTESVSQITFRQPNTVEEKVISIRTTGDDNNISPAPYIATSFYNPKINEAVSPLSPSAFAYYRFKYEGSFIEGDVMINKVRVTPRSRGERVFEGHIYIIENLWAIHSLDLTTSLLGFQIGIKQLYQPVAENVWMPSTHTYTFSGKIFGFAGEYQYLASTKDYQITLNPDLLVETKIIDEKVDEVPKDVVKLDKSLSTLEQMAQADQMTRKDFRKMVNAYEKEAQKEREDLEVVSERTYNIDSMATKRSLDYWDSIRPIKLTEEEIRGYQRDDSLAVVEAAKTSEVDTVARKSRRKFSPGDILTGGRYYFGKGRSAGFHSNLTRFSFNTVEGFKFGLAGFYRIEKSTKMADSVTNHVRSWNFRPEFRYGFSSQQPYGQLEIRRSVTQGPKAHSFGLTGGKYIFQFNADNPISEQVNALYSLFLRQNFMKLYEQDFIKGYFYQRFNESLTYRGSITYAQRTHLENNSDYSWYNRPERVYTPNQPDNVESEPGTFQDHRAFIWQNSIEWRPGLKYSIRNGRKRPIFSSAPLVNLHYTKAIPSLANDPLAADFDWLEAGIEHFFNFGVSGKLDFNLKAGSFLNNNRVYFMDFKHFGGNRTIFANMGVAANYRFMDYYRYSTQTEYVSAIVHYQFRKFLLTQLPMLRFSGVRENIFFNYLKTQNSPHYWELGYSLDNLFRIFRVEFGAGFENGDYLRSGVRFGIASFINISFDD